MSFFDSDYESITYSVTQPLADDPSELFAARQKKAILEAILSSKNQTIADVLLQDSMRPGYLNLTQYANFLANKYPARLARPYDPVYESSGDTGAVEAYFASQYESGRACSVQEIDISNWVPLDYVTYYYMQKTWGYNSVTNQAPGNPLNAQFGAATYVGYEHIRTKTGKLGGLRKYQMWRFTFTNGSKNYTVDIPGTNFYEEPANSTENFDGVYFGQYTVDVAPGEGDKYFILEVFNGNIYTIEGTLIPESYTAVETDRPDRFLSGIVLRAANVNYAEDPEREGYAEDAELMKRLQLDYKTMADEVDKQATEDRVNDTVILRLGVHVNSTAPAPVHYLMEFWKFYKIVTAVGDKAGFMAAWNSGASGADLRLLQKEMLYKETSIGAPQKFNILANYVDVRTVSGTIGAYGTTEVTETITGETRAYTIKKRNITTATGRIDGNSILYRRQIGINQIEEVEVGGPLFQTWVWDPDLEFDARLTTNLESMADENTRNFLIPINPALFPALNKKYLRELEYYVLHLYIEGYVVVEIKWYQKTEFIYFMKWASTALALVSAGQSWEAFLALVETYGVVGALVVAVLMSEIIQLAIEEILDLLAQMFGTEIAQIIALVAAVVLAAYGVYSKTPILKADQLLYLSNGLLEGASTINQEQFEELQRKNEEFLQESQKLEEELEAARKQLDTGINIDPFVVGGIQPLFLANETPSEYFSRTIHAGNVGTLGTEALHEYVNISLTLPKPVLATSIDQLRNQ